MNSKNIINIIKLLETRELLFKDEDEMKEYIWESGRLITDFVKKNNVKFKKFSTGYTIFLPDEGFRTGKWADFSPTFIVGLNEDEINKTVLSSYLYYLWPKKLPSYTELWLQKISAKYPYSIQMIKDNKTKNDFSVKIEDNLRLISIHFSHSIWKNLNKFHGTVIKVIEKKINIPSQIKEEYDFREIEEELEKINCSQEQKIIIGIYNTHKIQDIINSLSKQLNGVLPTQITQNDISNVAEILIKLLLIGPSCSVALRILNPKQLRIENKYVGNFGGILRVYKHKGGNLQDELMKLYPIAYTLTYNIGFRVLLHYVEKFRLSHALRSAIAAIMSRNMSHNIGSHVLANIGTTTDIIKKAEIQSLEKYIQQRMDFIAQISTEFPTWSYPCWFYKDMMRNFYIQKLLLEHIASSEGLSPYDYDKENSQQKKLKINFNTNNTKDYLVSIPGGIIGQQAFYIILEDIIRNAAKHNWATKEKNNKDINLEINIEVIDKPENDYYEVTIWDNISETSNAGDPPSNWEEILKSGDIKNLPLRQRINLGLIRSLIDETGKLRKENWGLAEMKISAGYLQKKKIEEIGAEGKEVLNIIKAVNKNGHLGYTFKMLKPKEVLIVGNNIIENDKIGKLRKDSIYIENELPEKLDYEFMVLYDDGQNSFIEKLKELKNDQNNEQKKKEIKKEIEKLPYRLFIATNDRNSHSKLDNFLNKRIVIIRKNEINGLLNDTSKSKELKLMLYSKWIDHLKGLRKISNKPSITIKVSGEESPSTLLIEELNNLGLNNNQKKEIISIFGLSENYQPSTLPNELRSGNITHDGEPWKNINGDFPFIFKDPPKDATQINLNDSNAIIYARHKELADNNTIYFESLSGAAQHFILLSNPPQDEYYKKKLLFQLVENALIRIAICDERVAQSSILSSPTGSSGQKWIFYLEAAKVFIIKKFLDYEIPNAMQYVDITISKNNNEYQITSSNGEIELDFLIIHQGILDKLNKTKQEIEEILHELKEKIPFIIVTSGRGTPPNIPENVKFLPFSNIESTILTKPHSKFILTQILMNLGGKE